jgi:nucleoid DNA-binding protein
MTTTRADIIHDASMLSGRPKDACALTLKAMLQVMEDYLAIGNRIQMRGHFTLTPKFRKPRPARNPRTGEPVALAKRKTVTGKFPKGYLK